ncbi:MAG: polyhydroxyalkanoate synthesis regulator DNA-binding domain-containing protein [Thermodesulfobacteriota bacterium]|nr:polyhydroxyalkanoate synthesis regulator DNA-binding domain-containing protein [Thermodesulfobacteriota bacterium]
MAEKILLKKYANRRLYDTEKSTYVTLNQVADMIKQGRRIEAIDAKTKEDVTAFILHQIILEEARLKNGLLPVSLLHLIIQYGETVLREFFEKYLQQTIENYLVYKTTFDEQFRKWLDLSMDLSDTAQKTMTGLLTPYKSLFDVFSGPAENQEKVEKK